MPIFFLIWFLLELWLLISVGGEIGFLWTVFEFILSAMIGIMVLRLQGIMLFARIREAMQRQIQVQVNQIGLLLRGLGGMLLIIPGFLSDVIGVLLLLPFIHQLSLLFFRKNTRTRIKIIEDD